MMLFPSLSQIGRHMRVAGVAIAVMFVVLGLYDLARAQAPAAANHIEHAAIAGTNARELFFALAAGTVERAIEKRHATSFDTGRGPQR